MCPEISRLWLNNLRDEHPLLANQIHVFSSFFYKKLNNKKNPEDGYLGVRKWTSKFDIFTKKYLIIPVNENVHWYLAIIHEPGHTLDPPFTALQHPTSNGMDDMDISSTDAVPKPRSEPSASTASSSPSLGIPSSHFYGTVLNGRIADPVVIEGNDNSCEGQQQETEVDNMQPRTQSASGDFSHTYIFTLDSLGTRHPQAIRVLKDYLKREAKDKHNFDEIRDALGMQVQVPVQPNTCDCGIYLLHFAKTFINAPSDFVDQILATKSTTASSDRKKMWKTQEIPHLRDYLSSHILQLSEEWKAKKTDCKEANKQKVSDTVDVETLSSEGEVDIVEDLSSANVTPGPKQKQLATRHRG